MSTVVDFPDQTRLASVVAANIRAECARRAINQLEIASHLGITQASVSPKWRGMRDWSLRDIEVIAQVLKVKPGQLLAAPADLYTPRDSNPEPTD